MINIGKLHVIRDDMRRWVEFIFEREIGAYVEQIKVLSKSNFLVIVGTYEEQQQILGASPLYMDRKIIVAMPWEMNLNKKPIKALDVPMWIDLISVDPML